MKQVLQTIENGSLKIINVPITINSAGKEIISGYTMYKMSHIFQYMIDNGITKYDFNNNIIKL